MELIPFFFRQLFQTTRYRFFRTVFLGFVFWQNTIHCVYFLRKSVNFMDEKWRLKANIDKNCDILSNEGKNRVSFVTKRGTSHVKFPIISYYLSYCLPLKEIRYLDGLFLNLTRRSSRCIKRRSCPSCRLSRRRCRAAASCRSHAKIQLLGWRLLRAWRCSRPLICLRPLLRYRSRPLILQPCFQLWSAAAYVM